MALSPFRCDFDTQQALTGALLALAAVTEGKWRHRRLDARRLLLGFRQNIHPERRVAERRHNPGDRANIVADRFRREGVVDRDCHAATIPDDLTRKNSVPFAKQPTTGGTAAAARVVVAAAGSDDNTGLRNRSEESR